MVILPLLFYVKIGMMFAKKFPLLTVYPLSKMIGGKRTRKKKFGLNDSTSRQSHRLYDKTKPTNAPNRTMAKLSGMYRNSVIKITWTSRIASTIISRIKNIVNESFFSSACIVFSSIIGTLFDWLFALKQMDKRTLFQEVNLQLADIL